MVMAPVSMAIDPFQGKRRARAPDTRADVPQAAGELVDKVLRDYILTINGIVLWGQT
jgi:hypothetical protein